MSTIRLPIPSARLAVEGLQTTSLGSFVLIDLNAPLQHRLAFYRSVTYQTSNLVHGFAKSHRGILFYRHFSLGFLLCHLVFLLLSFSHIIPSFHIYFCFPVPKEMTAKPLKISQRLATTQPHTTG